LVGEFIIEANDRLFVCKRKIRESDIKKITDWEDVLKKLYNVDRIFRKDGLLFLVKDIEDISELEVNND
tara:strand:+ start:857 stop:1063 length:207 start_codon:yes stop_codon:yes gene_type:complete